MILLGSILLTVSHGEDESPDGLCLVVTYEAVHNKYQEILQITNEG